MGAHTKRLTGEMDLEKGTGDGIRYGSRGYLKGLILISAADRVESSYFGSEMGSGGNKGRKKKEKDRLLRIGVWKDIPQEEKSTALIEEKRTDRFQTLRESGKEEP